jgi:hypothetical protein
MWHRDAAVLRAFVLRRGALTGRKGGVKVDVSTA